MTSGKSLARWSNATLFVCLVCKLVGTDLPVMCMQCTVRSWTCSYSFGVALLQITVVAELAKRPVRDYCFDV